MWLLVGSEIVLLREAVLALGGIVGLGAGLIERSRFGRLLLTDNSAEPPLDLPAEFRHVPRPFNHREDAMARRDRF